MSQTMHRQWLPQNAPKKAAFLRGTDTCVPGHGGALSRMRCVVLDGSWGWQSELGRSGFGKFSLVRETRAQISITKCRMGYLGERRAGFLEGQKLLSSGEMRDDFPQTHELRPFGKSWGRVNISDRAGSI